MYLQIGCWISLKFAFTSASFVGTTTDRAYNKEYSTYLKWNTNDDIYPYIYYTT